MIAITCPSIIQSMLPTRSPSNMAVSGGGGSTSLRRCERASKADQKVVGGEELEESMKFHGEDDVDDAVLFSDVGKDDDDDDDGDRDRQQSDKVEAEVFGVMVGDDVVTVFFSSSSSSWSKVVLLYFRSAFFSHDFCVSSWRLVGQLVLVFRDEC